MLFYQFYRRGDSRIARLLGRCRHPPIEKRDCKKCQKFTHSLSFQGKRSDEESQKTEILRYAQNDRIEKTDFFTVPYVYFDDWL